MSRTYKDRSYLAVEKIARKRGLTEFPEWKLERKFESSWTREKEFSNSDQEGMKEYEAYLLTCSGFDHFEKEITCKVKYFCENGFYWKEYEKKAVYTAFFHVKKTFGIRQEDITEDDYEVNLFSSEVQKISGQHQNAHKKNWKLPYLPRNAHKIVAQNIRNAYNRGEDIDEESEKVELDSLMSTYKLGIPL